MAGRTIIFLFACSGFVLGKNDKFEYECDVLERLDTLEKKLAIAESSLEQQTTEITTLKDQVSQQTTEIATLKDQASDTNMHQLKSGSTYVRWGRTSCPGNGTETVYSGYVGGSHFTHAGAAVDYLCLPKDPSYSYYKDGLQGGGCVYGAEYELDFRKSRMSFFPENDPTIDLLQKDVPCAVCKSARSSTIVVPARKTCHDGWTLEYQGYLSSGYTGHAAASEYVCLDGSPEYLVGGFSNDNGISFYFVEVVCGSLRCPPFVQGRELTCAICSK